MKAIILETMIMSMRARRIVMAFWILWGRGLRVGKQRQHRGHHIFGWILSLIWWV